MKLYLVWGIEFHAGRTLFGIYESFTLASDRKAEVWDGGYDDYVIEEVILNSPIS